MAVEMKIVIKTDRKHSFMLGRIIGRNVSLYMWNQVVAINVVRVSSVAGAIGESLE